MGNKGSGSATNLGKTANGAQGKQKAVTKASTATGAVTGSAQSNKAAQSPPDTQKPSEEGPKKGDGKQSAGPTDDTTAPKPNDTGVVADKKAAELAEARQKDAQNSNDETLAPENGLLLVLMVLLKRLIKGMIKDSAEKRQKKQDDKENAQPGETKDKKIKPKSANRQDKEEKKKAKEVAKMAQKAAQDHKGGKQINGAAIDARLKSAEHRAQGLLDKNLKSINASPGETAKKDGSSNNMSRRPSMGGPKKN